MEIRRGLADFSGDVRLTPSGMDFLGEESPINSEPSYIQKIRELDGVEAVTPVIYRAGIVKKGNEIQGVLFKGVAHGDSLKEGQPPKSHFEENIADKKIATDSIRYFSQNDFLEVARLL